MSYAPILSFFPQEFVNAELLKGSEGAVVRGKWAKGATTNSPLRIISPQPVKASDLIKLSDGEHVSDFVKTLIRKMDITTRENNKDPDHVVHDGKTYVVSQVDKRFLGPYLKLILKQVG